MATQPNGSGGHIPVAAAVSRLDDHRVLTSNRGQQPVIAQRAPSRRDRAHAGRAGRCARRPAHRNNREERISALRDLLRPRRTHVYRVRTAAGLRSASMASAAMRGGTRGKARLGLAQHMACGHSRRNCSSRARHTCARQRLGVPFQSMRNAIVAWWSSLADLRMHRMLFSLIFCDLVRGDIDRAR